MTFRSVFVVMVCFWSVCAIFAVGSPHQAEARGRICMPGTYLIEQNNGTQSLWTLSQHGAVHITSSAEAALQFSHEQGVWKQSGSRTAKITTLDFSLGPQVNGGVPPLSIARVDARLTFSKTCHRVEGSFELRFFDPQSEDALNPTTDTGDALTSTFTGRRLTVD